MAVLIVVGAGASYDSTAHQLPPKPGHPWSGWVSEDVRPPLARDLLTDRSGVMRDALADYPPLGAVAAVVRSAGRNIEELLEDYPARQSEVHVARQLVMLRMYLRDVLTRCGDAWHSSHKGATNYAGMFDLLTRHDPAVVHIVTFNYDLLIEYALGDVFGIVFDTLDSYLSGPWRLYKLHGSVDWGRILGPRTHSNLDPKTEMLQLDPRDVIGRVSDRYEKSRHYSDRADNILLPAIAIPLRSKAAFECPTSHVEALVEALPGVDRVITIGWKGAENHFVNLLARHLSPGVPIDVVSTSQGAGDTIENLLNRGERVSGDFRSLDVGFSGFLSRCAAQGRVLEHADFHRRP